MNTELSYKDLTIKTDEGIDKVKELLGSLKLTMEEPVKEVSNLEATVNIGDLEEVQNKFNKASEELTRASEELKKMETQKLGYKEESEILAEKLESYLNNIEELKTNKKSLELHLKECEGTRDALLEENKALKLEIKSLKENKEKEKAISKPPVVEEEKNDVDILTEATKPISKDFDPQNPQDIDYLKNSLALTQATDALLTQEVPKNDIKEEIIPPVVNNTKPTNGEIVDGFNVERDEKGNICKINGEDLDNTEQFYLNSGIYTVKKVMENREAVKSVNIPNGLVGGWDE